MSLFNTMRTSVAGMSAQANALSAIGDNIANSSTTGYKDASAQFETLVGNSSGGTYESGGVQTDVRYGVTDQGTLTTTTSATDLAVSGNGFFVVSQNGQGNYLTRAGSFVADSNGNLVNAAGYSLMGYAVDGSSTSSTLSVVNTGSSTLSASPSTSGTLSLNLPSTATAVASGTSPASEGTTSSSTSYTDKTSLTVYDDLGNADVLDVYMTKTGTNTWEATAYQQSGATNGGFPYASGSQVGTKTLTFSSTTGDLTSGSSWAISVPSSAGSSGTNTINLDMSSTTQLAADFSVTTATANGSSPSKLSSVSIGTDGTLTAVYGNGTKIPLYKIPLGTVTSPDNLTSLNGNVYQASNTSGEMVLGTPGSNGVGTIQSDSLEASTVDLATELTNMITAQRAYEANSKVLQAAADLLNTLNQLNIN